MLSKLGKAHKKLFPFEYPSKRHKRTETPLPRSNYRDYKPCLKQEFDGRCVYCRKSDNNQDSSAFHVDHYRPKSVFPKLERDYQNLFYSCAACNRFKSNYWSEIEEKKVLNPCDHTMSQHLAFSQASVVGRSDQGKLNIELLRLNNVESVTYRERQIENCRLLVEMVLKLKHSKAENDRDWIGRAIAMLSRLTHRDEKTVQRVLVG